MIRRTLDERLARGEEPTKAAVRVAVEATLPKPPTNVVSLAGRQQPLPSFAALDLETEAEAAADAVRDGAAIDMQTADPPW